MPLCGLPEYRCRGQAGSRCDEFWLMRPFVYERAVDLASASRHARASANGSTDSPIQYLAGGTTLLDLMKLDVLRPSRVVDLKGIKGLNAVARSAKGMRLGAWATMAEVADHPAVRAQYPVLAQSLELAASAQLRNMATLGGNVLQKTRCPFYRDPTWSACNRRSPGSGCTALTSVNRNHAILGVDESCIAQYPGDFGIALIALDAKLEIYGSAGSRLIDFADLHRPAALKPHIETSLQPGDIITAFELPALPWAARSLYLKIRDRSSYEFAIASVAVALDLEGELVRDVRLGLGGMAYRPWRANSAEAELRGRPLTAANAEAAARAAVDSAIAHEHNAYKIQLARTTIVRALFEAKTMSIKGNSA
jgi:xanthine dehydrogenase YagS FAD-binding subunit